MDQLIALFGHMGPFDLTVGPDLNARMALSAVTLSGKKAFFVKLRSLVKQGLFSMDLVSPGMDSSGPSTGSQWRVLRPER